MIVKTCCNDYMMQVAEFVYDYVEENGDELVVVAVSDNLAHYVIYKVCLNDSLSLEFTSMTDTEMKNHQAPLKRNLMQIIRVGREDYKQKVLNQP